MTIGKNSRMSSVRSSIRAPKFLDKSSGFYGRLDEAETTGDSEGLKWDGTQSSVTDGGLAGSPSGVTHRREETTTFDAGEGLMEDDGETLLCRKPTRRSSRWRRSSRRKQKEGRAEEEEEEGAEEGEGEEGGKAADPHHQVRVEVEVEVEGEKQREPSLVHFPVREEADDQVLIRDKKRGREEEAEEERRMRREQEEGMKVVKRNSMRNYRKALDRAFRRGWEAFITNLYSVTLTPVTSSSSPPSPTSTKKQRNNAVLAEFQ